jgi:hypothetical protein
LELEEEEEAAYLARMHCPCCRIRHIDISVVGTAGSTMASVGAGMQWGAWWTPLRGAHQSPLPSRAHERERERERGESEGERERESR